MGQGGTVGARVLIVEDHISTAAALSRLLRRQGYAVDEAHSLRAAVNLLQSHQYATVLSDIGLPDGNGCAVMAEVRRAQASASAATRGIIMSGHTDEATVCAARDAGFSRFLIKPVTFADVLKAIEDLTPTSPTADLIRS